MLLQAVGTRLVPVVEQPNAPEADTKSRRSTLVRSECFFSRLSRVGSLPEYGHHDRQHPDGQTSRRPEAHHYLL